MNVYVSMAQDVQEHHNTDRCLFIGVFHVSKEMTDRNILCWIGEFLVDPVLPVDPYFSRSSANSCLHRDKDNDNTIKNLQSHKYNSPNSSFKNPLDT